MAPTRAARRWIVLALLLASGTTALAKGQTVRLLISGGTLARPVETTEPKTLANVWAGRFIGEPAVEPDVRLPRYQITFYVCCSRGESVMAMYMVTFVRDAEGRGFVYLPGPGERGWRMNVSSILREGQDGHWHHAEPEWSDAVAAALK